MKNLSNGYISDEAQLKVSVLLPWPVVTNKRYEVILGNGH